MLLRFSTALDLVGDRDLDRLRDRHVEDSLRARQCLRPDDHRVADVGSGAGLPGIPLAIAEPGRSFLLIERHQRRAGFLELAQAELALQNVEIIPRDVATVAVTVDACTCRAFGSLEESWRKSNHLLGAEGCLIYYAGANWTPPGDAVGPLPAAELCAVAGYPWQGPLVMIRRRQPGAHDGTSI